MVVIDIVLPFMEDELNSILTYLQWMKMKQHQNLLQSNLQKM